MKANIYVIFWVKANGKSRFTCIFGCVKMTKQLNCIYFSAALSKQTSFSNSNIQLRLVKSTNPRKRTYCFFSFSQLVSFYSTGIIPLLRFVKMISNAIKICFNTLKCHYLDSMEREKTWHLCKLTSTHEAGSTQSSRVVVTVYCVVQCSSSSVVLCSTQSSSN